MIIVKLIERVTVMKTTNMNYQTGPRFSSTSKIKLAYFRKIRRNPGFAVGDTQYHTDILEKSGKIKSRSKERASPI